MAVEFELLKLRPVMLRLDALPFLGMYVALLYWQLSIQEETLPVKNSEGEEEEYIVTSMESVYARLALIGIVFLNSLVFLCSYWSTHFKARIQYFSGGTKITRNAIQKFPIIKNSFKAYYHKQQTSYCEIVLIDKYYDAQQQDQKGFCFKFMEAKYYFDEPKNTFTKLKPDTHFQLDNLSQIANNLNHDLFQKNLLLVPIKKFTEVLREELMQPFSFFQIFSISLWLLDENMLYSLFTLFLLFMTACTIVIQRMRTMLTLRQMKINPSFVTIYRNNNWAKISSEDLVPGDIMIVQTVDQVKPVSNSTKQQLTEDEQFLREQVPFSKHLPEKLFKTESMNVDSHRCVPCDILLLNGTCVVNEAMLTGESVPQVKDSVEKSGQLDIKNKHKSSVLFCGTEVIQTQGNLNFPEFIKGTHPHCLGLVLRTGFDTAKGRLIRSFFYNNENVQSKQVDGMVILVMLLVFAIISSANVLYHGLHDSSRDKNKLFLRCILIVTTVVPPELPMILSISVNQSLLFLQMKKIFCTEPFRIPWAGKVTVLAFDKTGTLTKDSLNFTGILDEIPEILDEDCKQLKIKGRVECDHKTQIVLAGCQQLIYADQELQGDPIELLFFENNNRWSYQAQSRIITQNFKENGMNFSRTVQIKGSFPFRSNLKRMSTLVTEDFNNQSEIKLLTKGAPETLEPLLTTVPKNFTQAYQFYANQGFRVLCLADKVIPLEKDLSILEYTSQLIKEDRNNLEQGLTFRGLLICESPLKKDTITWMDKFKKSYFTPIIITGDNTLTAIAVAKQLKLSKQDVYILDFTDSSLKWTLQDGSAKPASNALQEEATRFSQQGMLCLTTNALANLPIHNLSKLLVLFTVFARMSPKQKEQIIVSLKQGGYGVLMCGDGTNDVGALKKAHVGIALVTKKEKAGEEAKEDQEEDDDEQQDNFSFFQTMQKAKEQREQMRKQFQENRGNPAAMKQAAQQQLKEQTNQLFDMGQSYKFGDACIAAPFTYKMSTSIRCVFIILKQGVCTLVTTITTYKIMALLSLLNAYSLSSLHMQALKLSSSQMTIMGVFGAGYYFCYSNAKAQRQLSKIKPSSSIFEWNFFLSLILQISLHILMMEYALNEVGIKNSTAEELKVDHDAEFKPTFLNTIVFILQILQQSCIFLFNHPGEPHMQRIEFKSKFFKSLIIPICLCLFCCLNISTDLNDFFELQFPQNQNATTELFLVCLTIVIINYLIERAMKFLKYRAFYGYI